VGRMVYDNYYIACAGEFYCYDPSHCSYSIIFSHLFIDIGLLGVCKVFYCLWIALDIALRVYFRCCT
jgi:hypothetical protein